jgi:transglutaminase-like putative cysteine protease
MAYSDIPDEEGTAYGYDDEEEDYKYYEKQKPKRSRRRYGSIVSTIVVLVICLLLILLVTNAEFRKGLTDLVDRGSGGYREYPHWADFSVRRSITVSPHPPGFPMDYSVDIPAPIDIGKNETRIQEVKSIVTSPAPVSNGPYPGYDQDYKWMLWEENNTLSSRTFSITYTMRTESALWSLDSSDSGTVDDYPESLVKIYGNKTREEWKILPTHPQIVSLSDQLTSGKITVYDKFKSIFDYINDNFEYETLRGGEPKFCNETLSDRFGDCDDQSVLFVSLARAAGLPALLEFGALYNQQEQTWGGHAWVKVFIPEYTTGEVYWYNIDIVNDQFLFRDAYRFSEWESDGNATHLKDYYYSYGVNFRYDENYATINMRVSSNTIKIGEDGRPLSESVPGFEVFVMLSAVVLCALVSRKK